ncbi:hypothetical protein RHODGE_RHODGE_02917 [Rhodoplanes serenus]|uniref:Transposase IS30-like HTH domain-containing protein n=1 Tax=Rhodoplanes serenus TaxID=200615 RepID=A0A3S4B5L0_9BRAD|nr:AAA family ATPase [Rhodoplanes serenus]VCU09748.1 hypothetical protein RHODGE_RHODGE_02917 [Rhodoplanes serenus]
MKPDANAILIDRGLEELRNRFDDAFPHPAEHHVYDPEPEETPSMVLDTIDIEDFARLDLPPREYVLKPIIPVRGLAMLFAGRGIGKTFVAMNIAFAVSCGGEFLRWKADAARPVLYVDGEMPQEALQERILAMDQASDVWPEKDFFRLLSMDRQALGVSLNLANPKHQAAIEDNLGDAKFLVIDNLSTLVNGGAENDAESWIAMQEWLLRLRRKGVSVLVVHHAGRSGNARGTSKREDVLDTVIQLKRPEGYDPRDGARFEVHLTKARGVFGDDANPFEAKLKVIDGRAVWTDSDLDEDEENDTIIAMRQEGKSVRAIADATGRSKSSVHRVLEKAKEQGFFEVPSASDLPGNFESAEAFDDPRH